MQRRPIKDEVYRRSYRLYNRLFGRMSIRDSAHPYHKTTNTPLNECRDMRAVGAVLLEGWISA